MLLKELLDSLEPPLSWVREVLREQTTIGREKISEVRREPLSVEAVLECCRRYCEVFCASQWKPYDPATLLRSLSSLIEDSAHVFKVGSASRCVGDVGQLAILLETLLAGVVLEEDSALVTELSETEGVPRVLLTLDGPGCLPVPISFSATLRLSMAEFEAQWTAATRGGRIDRTPAGLELRLSGVRKVRDPISGLEEVLESLRQAEQSSQRFAASEQGLKSSLAADALQAVERALAHVDGPVRAAEPANLEAGVRAVSAQWTERLAARTIAFVAYADPILPPIIVRRDRLLAFFRSAFAYAEAVLSSGGAVSVFLDYAAEARNARVTVTITGSLQYAEETIYFSSMRRAIEETHEGTFARDRASDCVTLTALLPDLPGRRLDEWIPGWEVFSEGSRRSLRLLKSGGSILPEDVLLAGVLEEELERWLLPYLSAPPATNLAHDLDPRESKLSENSRDRLQKALGQIRREKPKKEIAKPPYAAEILWAFRISPRHRKAVGAENLAEDDLRALCLGLLQTPPDYVCCLRLIAKARSPHP